MPSGGPFAAPAAAPAPARPPRQPNFASGPDIRPAMPGGIEGARDHAPSLQEDRAPSSGGFDPLAFDADDLFGGPMSDPFAEAQPFGDVEPGAEEPAAPGPATAAPSGAAPAAAGPAGSAETDAPSASDEPSRTRGAASEVAAKASKAARKPMPQWVGEAVGWTALGASSCVFVAGLLMAGWATHVVDLDAVLMPTMESGFDVRPPRSSLGLDDAVLSELEDAARKRRVERDLGLEAVAWRRVLEHAPGNEPARRRLAKLLTLLGEGRSVDAILK